MVTSPVVKTKLKKDQTKPLDWSFKGLRQIKYSSDTYVEIKNEQFTAQIEWKSKAITQSILNFQPLFLYVSK